MTKETQGYDASSEIEVYLFSYDSSEGSGLGLVGSKGVPGVELALRSPRQMVPSGHFPYQRGERQSGEHRRIPFLGHDL